MDSSIEYSRSGSDKYFKMKRNQSRDSRTTADIGDKHGAKSFDDCIWIAGGFGRFQVFASIILTLAFTTGGEIVYGLAFLEKYPDYECQVGGQWLSCDR